MKLQRLAALCAAGLMALTACGQTTDAATNGTSATPGASTGEKIVLEHVAGTTELDAPATKVVVLDFAALDTIQALGMGDVVVGVPKGTALPTQLSAFETDKVTDVGSLKEPDLEKIAQLGPDLIIAGGRSSSLVPELSKLFPTIDNSIDANADYLDEMERSALLTAKAIGKESEAKAKLDELEAKIADAKTKFPAGTRALTLMATGGKVTAVHPNGRFDLGFDSLGLTSAVEAPSGESNAHGDPLSFEAIQKANPDVAFVIDRDAAIGQEGSQSAQQLLDNELVRNTNAWKNGKVVYLDGPTWYLISHGIDATSRMLDDLLQAA